MEQNNEQKGLTRFLSANLKMGIGLTLLSVLMAWIGGHLPFGIALIGLAGVPLSILCVKQKWWHGVLATVAATVLLLMVQVELLAIYLLTVVPIGLIAGILIAKRKKASAVITWSTVVTLAAIVLLMIVPLLLSGATVGDIVAAYYEPPQAMMDEMMQMAEEMELFESFAQQGVSKTQALEMMYRTYEMTIQLLPSIVILMFLLRSMVHYWACSYVLKRMDYKVRKVPRFERWAMSSKHIFVIIALWVILLAKDMLPPWLGTFAMNLIIVYAIALTVVGVAVIMHKTNLRNSTPGKRMIGYTMLVFAVMYGIVIFAALVGLFDLILDIRKLEQEKEEARARYEEKKAMQAQQALEQQSEQELVATPDEEEPKENQ